MLRNQPLAHRVIHIPLHPRARLRQAMWRVVHLIRLRKLWSQCGALLQVRGRRSYLRELLELFRICPRRSARAWSLQRCWAYLGPIVRRAAPMFRHLVRRHGNLQHRSKPRERNFRRIVLAQIDANGWWNWTDTAVRSRRHLGPDIDSPVPY